MTRHTFNMILLIVNSLLFQVAIVVGNDLVLQKCLPKADMENVAIRCEPDEIIAIKEAFFTSSVSEQCPFLYVNRSSEANEIEDARTKSSCLDDLRISLNSKCSGHSNCTVNLRKAHSHRCAGFGGWINIKYTCVQSKKLHSYCNIELSDNYGYISNPGYPKFYPQYNCKWKLQTFLGQKIQIEILDFSLKEPRFTNKKLIPYECSDYLSIVEDNAKVVTLCGETKSNLIDYRSKGTQLIVELVSYDFSPTRGVLIKYSMLNCPTLKAPSNGYMYRNASYSYYNCNFDYVFEDTGLPSRVLYCEYDIYWNGTVTRCLPKENVTLKAYALINQNDQPSLFDSTTLVDEETKSVGHTSNKLFAKGYLAPLLLVAAILIITLAVIIVLFQLRKNAMEKTSV